MERNEHLMNTEIKSLKTKIEEMKHAILRPEENGNGNYLVETFRVTDDGRIYCFCEDASKEDIFEASLKFIDKENGEYLLVHGTATRDEKVLPPRITTPGAPGTVFAIDINTAQYFQRELCNSFASDLNRKAIWKLRQGWSSYKKAI